MIRSLSALFGALFCMVAAVAPAQAQDLGGTYYGLDGAQGLTLQLDGRATGRISAPDGSGQAIQGREENGSVIAELIFQGKRGTARFTPKGIGIGMTWTAGDGTGETVFAFRRRDLELPAVPAGFIPEPPMGTRNVEPSAFLSSYEFWQPNTVGFVYDTLEEKYRAIMRLFPTVHADLIWKLCQSTSQPMELGEALRGEGVTCAEVDRTIKEAQRTDAFSRFKRRVHAQRTDAVLAVECARGLHQTPVCADAARRTQRAASSLETVKTVLRGI